MQKGNSKAADYVIEFNMQEDFPFLKKQLEESFIRYYGRTNRWEAVEDFFKHDTQKLTYFTNAL
jgi:hypothetical protein